MDIGLFFYVLVLMQLKKRVILHIRISGDSIEKSAFGGIDIKL